MTKLKPLIRIKGDQDYPTGYLDRNDCFHDNPWSILGSSIPGWLTDDGKEWLNFYKKLPYTHD